MTTETTPENRVIMQHAREIFAGGGGLPAKSILSKLPIALDMAGNHPTTPLTDILSIVCTTIPDAASETSAEVTWRELR